MKTLTQNFYQKSTAFNEFPNISNKHIDFFLKIYHGFNKHYHNLEVRSLFAIVESLKSVGISAARICSKFKFKSFSFKCQIVSNYIAVALQLCIVKFDEFKEEEIITFWKIKSHHWGGIRNNAIKGSRNI